MLGPRRPDRRLVGTNTTTKTNPKTTTTTNTIQDNDQDNDHDAETETESGQPPCDGCLWLPARLHVQRGVAPAVAQRGWHLSVPVPRS